MRAVREQLGLGLMLGLAALYALGFLLGWGNYASWHLLLVIIAVLLLFTIMSKRGT